MAVLKPQPPIKFLKVREVKSPTRAYDLDAGIDFYVPKFKKEFIKDLKDKNPLVFGEPENLYTGAYHKTTTNTGTITFQGNSSAEVKYELEDKNYSIIRFDEETGLNYFLLAPHSRIMIPSGIKSRMAEPGRALIAANKSGVATKHGFVYGAQVVDYTYKGEIHLSLINTSTKAVRIYEGMKILQFVETPVFTSPIEIVEVPEPTMHWDKDPEVRKQIEEEFYKGLQDDRGAGGFGSTDKK